MVPVRIESADVVSPCDGSTFSLALRLTVHASHATVTDLKTCRPGSPKITLFKRLRRHSS
jgi:hypothetical protein